MVFALCLVFGSMPIANLHAKPPGLPARYTAEGRVPLFPLGDEYREADAPATRDLARALNPPPNLPIYNVFRAWIGLRWLPETPLYQLLLPPIER
jgi:hypothetical protein